MDGHEFSICQFAFCRGLSPINYVDGKNKSQFFYNMDSDTGLVIECFCILLVLYWITDSGMSWVKL